MKISFDKRSITTTIARYTARAMKKLPPMVVPKVKNPPCTLAPPIKRNKSRYANGVNTNHVAPVKSAPKIMFAINTANVVISAPMPLRKITANSIANTI